MPGSLAYIISRACPPYDIQYSHVVVVEPTRCGSDTKGIRLEKVLLVLSFLRCLNGQLAPMSLRTFLLVQRPENPAGRCYV